jgi:hypothetical protein
MEADEANSETLPTAEPVHEWFDDEDDENLWVKTDIINIITMHLKEVKRFHTPRAFKAFTDLTAVMQYIKLRERYRCNPRCTHPWMQASLAIATRCGKGASNGTYFARWIHANEHYLQKVISLHRRKTVSMVTLHFLTMRTWFMAFANI